MAFPSTVCRCYMKIRPLWELDSFFLLDKPSDVAVTVPINVWLSSERAHYCQGVRFTRSRIFTLHRLRVDNEVNEWKSLRMHIMTRCSVTSWARMDTLANECCACLQRVSIGNKRVRHSLAYMCVYVDTWHTCTVTSARKRGQTWRLLLVLFHFHGLLVLRTAITNQLVVNGLLFVKHVDPLSLLLHNSL